VRTQHTASVTPTSTTERGLTRKAWHKITDVIHEMNYAACRLAKLNVTVR
jgi:hypothetical protein